LASKHLIAINRFLRTGDTEQLKRFRRKHINTRDGRSYLLNEIPQRDVITLGDVLCGYIQHPEIKSLGPNGDKCKPETRGLLKRISIKGGLQHAIGKEISRFEQGQDGFIENIEASTQGKI
jgi:hypothetical protein